MVAEIIATSRSGRSGLNEMEVNLATFLALQQRLDAGEKLPFNERQLQLSFARWLAESGQGTHGQTKNPEKMMAVAQYLVSKHAKVLDNARSLTPEKRAAYLAENGLIATAADKMPKNIRDAAPNDAQATERKISATQTALGIAADLFEIAEMSTNPTMAVISVLAADAVAGGVNHVAKRGAQILTDTLEKHATSDEAKDMCIRGLNRLLGPSPDVEPSEQLQALAGHEIAHGSDRIAVDLQKIHAPQQADQLENALAHRKETAQLQQTIEKTPKLELVRADFLANSADATHLARAARQEQVQTVEVQQALIKHPYLIKGMIAPVPKPPSWATDALRKKDENA